MNPLSAWLADPRRQAVALVVATVLFVAGFGVAIARHGAGERTKVRAASQTPTTVGEDTATTVDLQFFGPPSSVPVTTTTTAATAPKSSTTSTTTPADQPGIYVMAFDGTAKRRVATDQAAGGGGPALAPDGSRVAYAGGDGRLWVVNADGTNAHSISGPNVSPRAGPSHSAAQWLTTPDPARPRLLYAAADGPQGSVHSVNVDGTEDQVLTPSGQAVIVAFGASGNTLTWSDGLQIWQHPVDASGEAHKLTDHAVDAGSIEPEEGVFLFTGGGTWMYKGGLTEVAPFAADSTEWVGGSSSFVYSGDGKVHAGPAADRVLFDRGAQAKPVKDANGRTDGLPDRVFFVDTTDTRTTKVGVAAADGSGRKVLLGEPGALKVTLASVRPALVAFSLTPPS